MAEIEFTDNDYRNLMKYRKYLLENTRPAQLIRPFRFYAFNYDFDKELRSHEVIRYWDMQPLVFVFHVYKFGDAYNFVGINLHHLPIQSRFIWLARIKKLQKAPFEENKIIRMKWNQLFRMYIKANKFAVRQYRIERAYRIRKIENSEVDSIMRFYANTYYGATYMNIVAKYRKFRAMR